MIAAAPSADFLARVAMHSLGVATTIRPRLPSLFEDRRADALGENWDDLAETVFAAPLAWRPQAPVADLQVTAPDGQSLTNRSNHRSNREATPAPPVDRATVDRRPPDEVPLSRQVRIEPAPPSAPSPVRADSSAIAAAPADAIRRRVRPAEPPVPPEPDRQLSLRRAEQRAELEAPVVRAPRAKQTEAAVKPARNGLSQPRPVPAATPAAIPMVMPAPLPVPLRREAAIVQPAPTPAVISISIGRIEIRAVSSPLAPPPVVTRSNGARPQSLDDYLTQRADRK